MNSLFGVVPWVAIYMFPCPPACPPLGAPFPLTIPGGTGGGGVKQRSSQKTAMISFGSVDDGMGVLA